MKLVESLIGREVTVGQGSECHLTFVRGLLHTAQQDPRIVNTMLFKTETLFVSFRPFVCLFTLFSALVFKFVTIFWLTNYRYVKQVMYIVSLKSSLTFVYHKRHALL